MRTVYGTWGMHDELGDRVELTEDLADKALDRIITFRKVGWQIETFVIDYPWYDTSGELLTFRERSWINNGSRFRARLEENHITLGLWFPVSGRGVISESWSDSLSKDNVHYSLAEGSFASGLVKAIERAIEDWGVRFIKLDFAAFDAASRDSLMTPEEAYEKASKLLLSVLNDFKGRYQDLEIIAHCGWFPNLDAAILGSNLDYGIDPSWLAGVDRMFSGDPTLCDLPSTDLAANLRTFQDRQVWQIHREGFPLPRIDDHGVIVAKTNTALYLGSNGFRDSWIGSLSRGRKGAMLYGDPYLISNDDAMFAVDATHLFGKAFEMGLETVVVGPGEPGIAPWHGFLTGGGMAGLLYISNPKWTPVEATLSIPILREASLIYTNQEGTSIHSSEGTLQINLPPESCACIGIGIFAQESLPCEQHKRVAQTYKLISSRNGQTARLEGSAGQYIVLSQASVSDIRFANGRRAYRFGHEDERERTVQHPLCHKLVRHHTTAQMLEQLPGVPTWSGTSWVISRLSSSCPWELEVESALPESVQLSHSVFEVVPFECRSLPSTIEFSPEVALPPCEKTR